MDKINADGEVSMKTTTKRRVHHEKTHVEPFLISVVRDTNGLLQSEDMKQSEEMANQSSEHEKEKIWE